jgi:hypothetical protein
LSYLHSELFSYGTPSSQGVGIFQEEVVATHLLLLVHLGLVLVDSGTVAVGVTAEGDVEILEELVAACEEGLGRVGAGVDGRLAIEDNDAVGKVGRHDEIVLDDEGGFLAVHDEALDDASGDDTLLRVEVAGNGVSMRLMHGFVLYLRAGLVDQVDVGGNTKSQHNGNTL